MTTLDAGIYETLHKYTKVLAVALGYRDQMTRLHSDRVQGISIELGKRCGLGDEALEALGLGASFHDVGKIGIPDHILLKPSQFERDEWEVMKQHAEIGEKIMLSTELRGCERAAQLIRHHHEHYDGSGYPDGFSGEGIPVCSRIISIADSYDAMAVTRSYHMAKRHEEILAVLDSESGKKHDPELVDLFHEIIEKSQFRTD